MDITQIIPAPANQERLPAYCSCCGCITRNCICSCCCAVTSAAPVDLAALADDDLMNEAVRCLHGREHGAFRAAYAEMDARLVRRVAALVGAFS